MAQPVPYVRSYSFTDFQVNNPTTPLPGNQVDSQFNAIQQTLSEVLTNLALIQRDDGNVANQSVGIDQLKPEVMIGINSITDWITGHVYTTEDAVWELGKLYRCIVNHTSGVFATDFSGGKWLLILDAVANLQPYIDELTAASTAALIVIEADTVTCTNAVQQTTANVTATDADVVAAAASAAAALTSKNAAATSATGAAASAVAAAASAASIATLFLINMVVNGADITGVSDSSPAWATTASAANTSASVAIGSGPFRTTGAAYFPSGDYKIDTGVSQTNTNLTLVSEGRENVRIKLGSGQLFLNSTSSVYSLSADNFCTTSGGKGFWNHTSTSTNDHGLVSVSFNNFYDYTGVALGSLSTDFPYITLKNNILHGAVGLTSKGIVLCGDNAGSEISGNKFERNLYDLQCQMGQRMIIANNDFTRFTNGGGSPSLVSMWFVPAASAVGAGNGIMVSDNNFGSENNNVADYKIIYADLGTGTNAFDKVHSTSVSTGYVIGITYRDNNFDAISNMTNGVIYSYTPRVRYHIFDSRLGGNYFPYIFHFDAGVTQVDSQENATNIVYIKTAYALGQQSPTQVSNFPGIAQVVDPFGLAYDENFKHTYMNGSDEGYVQILTSDLVSSFTLFNATVVATTDSKGGSNATTVTFTGSNGFTAVNIDMTKCVVGQKAFICFDVQTAAANSLGTVNFQLVDNSGNAAAQRFIKLTAGVTNVRMEWTPVQTSTQLKFRFQPVGWTTSTAIAFRVGLPQVYHARQVINRATRFLENYATYNPPSLLALGTTTTTVTVTGAVLGDIAKCSFSNDQGSIMFHPWVSAADTVTVLLYNLSGGTLDLASGTLRVRIEKPMK